MERCVSFNLLACGVYARYMRAVLSVKQALQVVCEPATQPTDLPPLPTSTPMPHTSTGRNRCGQVSNIICIDMIPVAGQGLRMVET
jgi:hypothetical protein